MRENLYRGKDRWGGWHYGFYTEGYYLDGTPVSWIEVVDRKKKETDSPTVAPDTVGQFTGLTDQNGTKIFEGDIVEVNHDACPGARGEVFFKNGSFMLKKVSDVLSLYGFLPWCEVIGNIHDNPELLEG